MRLALYVGTFDPIHLGHILSVEIVREHLQFDKVVFVPSKHPPNKLRKSITDGQHRLRMIELSIEDNPYFEVSDVELQAEDNISYTWVTIDAFKQKYPKADIYLLLGADTVYDLPNWQYLDKIVAACTIVGFQRGGEQDLCQREKPGLGEGARLILVDTPQLEISSTDIRQRLSEGKTTRYMLHDKVLHYIKEHCLYE